MTKVLSRLDSKDPALAQRLRSATVDDTRRAVLAACTIAAEANGIDDAEIARALEILRTNVPPGADFVDALNARAASWDEEYFRLEDEGAEADKPHALQLFSRARVVTALAIALAGDPGQLHEAIYEALSSVDDSSRMSEAAMFALSSK